MAVLVLAAFGVAVWLFGLRKGKNVLVSLLWACALFKIFRSR